MPSELPGEFDIFLSHSHDDAEVVERLGARLADEAGLVVWLDKWMLVPGTPWQQGIAKGLEHAKTCAVCIGEHTPRGWFREEIRKALNRQTKDATFRVIPLILPNGDSSAIEEFLELRTWVDFRGGVDDARAFHSLKCGVLGMPPGRERPTSDGSEHEARLMRERLRSIRDLHSQHLIDDVIALEYQRIILDQHVMGGKR